MPQPPTLFIGTAGAPPANERAARTALEMIKLGEWALIAAHFAGGTPAVPVKRSSCEAQVMCG